MTHQKYRSNIKLSIIIVMLLESLLVKAAQWRDLWRDDFNGAAGSQPSSSNWIYDIGISYPGGPKHWGTGEVQSYTSKAENVRLDGKGNLLIIPLRDGQGKWTSARIETQRTYFKPSPEGKLAIEGRIQVPNVTGKKAIGYWPAFWAIGAPFRGNYTNWPSIGEIDIMENVNGLNFVNGALHCGVLQGGPCDENKGRKKETACPTSSCPDAFQTYRIEWDESTSPKEFRWFVDGKQYHRVNRNDIGINTWNQITKHGYFILLNVAMGGGYPNFKFGKKTPIPETEPGHPMVVDYVAVYTFV